MAKTRIAFFTNNKDDFQGRDLSSIDAVYGHGRRQQIEALADAYPELIGNDNFAQHVGSLSELEVIFSTWGFPILTEEQLDQLPNLKAIFYGAGATPWRRRFEKRGIKVCSGTAANAIPVAEFALTQILLCLKGVLKNMRLCFNRESMLANRFAIGQGVYGARISLLGNGSIARHLHKLLAAFDVETQMLDSYDLASDLSLLESTFRESDVVSNHLPDLGSNHRVLTATHFANMPQGASFVNTGRGQQVDEAGLIDVLYKRPDLTAILDVQDPEPPHADSPLYILPNVYLTSHIAGAFNDEFIRIADYMIADFKRWLASEPLQYEVKADML